MEVKLYFSTNSLINNATSFVLCTSHHQSSSTSVFIDLNFTAVISVAVAISLLSASSLNLRHCQKENNYALCTDVICQLLIECKVKYSKY